MQVLINLLSNAAKFAPAGAGRVEVQASVEAGALRVDVRDNGPGIRAADHPVVFERFRQVGDALTDRPGGTGLGLPISKRIVEHFGGRLWVESDLGQCATFSFVLPLEPPGSAGGEGVPEALEGGRRR
jgi:signal transduction histidine kinase